MLDRVKYGATLTQINELLKQVKFNELLQKIIVQTGRISNFVKLVRTGTSSLRLEYSREIMIDLDIEIDEERTKVRP